ncbi:MAG: Phosphoheptose isomerase-like protein [Actinomycetia bacterium]|nr:Phosphoheptose isomerase-like protein [Actinomycetes bacterium]
MIGLRTEANERFFVAEAERIAELSLRLAERFLAGGRLLAVGASPQDRSDAHHVAVEFVHPVIVGKRALPALALRADELTLHAEPGDAVIAFGLPVNALRGCLTIGFAPGAAEWEFEPPTDDPFVRQELVETLYHVLWESVHVFLEHLGSSGSGAGSSGFLYPFLERGEVDLDAVLEDVARSVVLKAHEVGELRERTIGDGTEVAVAAAALRERLDAGGKLLAFGNGGSATDAMDVVADLQTAGRRALDLTADAAVLTALANDVGPEVLFQRQIIAHGREGDVALAISTSGGSANIIAALAEARRRGLETIAIIGYDGGRIAAEQLADHMVVAPSEYIPRIQEAHATAYHLLCERVSVGRAARKTELARA